MVWSIVWRYNFRDILSTSFDRLNCLLQWYSMLFLLLNLIYEWRFTVAWLDAYCCDMFYILELYENHLCKNKDYLYIYVFVSVNCFKIKGRKQCESCSKTHLNTKKSLNIFFKTKYFLHFFMIIKIKRRFGINVKAIRHAEWVQYIYSTTFKKRCHFLEL